MRWSFSIAFAAGALAVLGGCASVARPVQSAATINAINSSSFAGYRFLPTARDLGATPASPSPDQAYDVLALSGGGPDGAYGAGLLAGWSIAGTRPQFEVVTGVSTGALMAPFAFLGPAYDEQLRELYTGAEMETLLGQGSPLRLAQGPSIYRSDRLRGLISANVDAELLAAVAREHRAGRRLYVATVNIDAQQMVVWDMGAIAGSAPARAEALLESVLLAAASVPVAFDPVLFPISDAANAPTEAHADASLLSQIYAGTELFPTDCGNVQRTCTLHVIVHNKTLAEPETVPLRAIAMVRRSFETLLKGSLRARLEASAAAAQANNIAFRMAYLDVPFEGVTAIDFDLEYMRAIYALGRDAGMRPESWLIAVPPDV